MLLLYHYTAAIPLLYIYTATYSILLRYISNRRQLQDLKEEVVWLRERAGMPADGSGATGVDLSKLRLKSQASVNRASSVSSVFLLVV